MRLELTEPRLLVAATFLGDALERQRRVVGQMTRITENLLALARPDDGRTNVRREPVDLPRLVRDVCDDFAPIAEEAEVRLACEIASDVAQASCDDVCLGELVQNLVSNAVKFTPSGGSITVRIAPGADEVVRAVEDTGPGVPFEHRQDVFRRFYRVGSATDPRSGAGLGLAISAWIADEHGGRIEILDRPGGGSVFRVRLPRTEDITVSAA